jgi:hypothetical protein
MVAEQEPEIDLDTSFDEWLRKTVELLCAQRPPLFQLESELRLCQRKTWLLDYGDDLNAVQRTAMTFAAARIAARMVQLRRKRRHEPLSSRLIKALRDFDLRSVFDFAFSPTSHLYSLLLESYSFKQVFDWAAKDADEIRCLNDLTRWRLRLANTEGFRPTLNAGL